MSKIVQTRLVATAAGALDARIRSQATKRGIDSRGGNWRTVTLAEERAFGICGIRLPALGEICPQHRYQAAVHWNDTRFEELRSPDM
jgi:hypothetical protein